MLKYIPVYLLVVLLSLTACGATDDNPGDIAPVESESVATQPPPLPATEEAAAPPAAPATEEPATPAPVEGETVLVFRLDGGVIGFCDTLTIGETGAYVLESCSVENSSGTLEQGDLDTLLSWHENLASFQVAVSDDPDVADALSVGLTFTGIGPTVADEGQQQVILDWINGLHIRLRPQPVAAPPTPTLTAVQEVGLCPDIQRPAVLLASFTDPTNITMVDIASLEQCEFLLEAQPFGGLRTVGGNIYYAAVDEESMTVTVQRLSSDGVTTSLDFTTVTMPEIGPYSFTVSPDGSQIAWAHAVVDSSVDPPIYTNQFWRANIDGSAQTTLIENSQNSERMYIAPVRFSPDNSSIFYAMQPDGLGGINLSFSGRYNSIYEIPATGGESRLIYVCEQERNIICIGDITADGSYLAYADIEANLINVLDGNGNLVNSIVTPATDYIGQSRFGPDGTLAFISMALFQENDAALPMPTPGYVSFVDPPYTGEARVVAQNDSIAVLLEWVDAESIAYGPIYDFGNLGTGIITQEGELREIAPNFALAILR